MADIEISENGIYVETHDGAPVAVVHEPPTQGVQIVAPGAVFDEAAKDELKRYEDVIAGVSNVGTIGTKGTIEQPVEQPAEEKAADKPAPRKAKS